MKFKQYFYILLTSIAVSSCGSQPKEFQGYIEGENTYISSNFSGILEKLWVKRGQEIHKGDKLFKLDSNPQTWNIKEAQNNLLQAQNNLADLMKPERKPEIAAIQAKIEQTDAEITLAKVRVSRFQTLFERKAGSKDTLDAAIAELKQQEQLKAQYQANLELAQLGDRIDKVKAQQSLVASLQAKLNQAEWELSQKMIYAPNSGIIFDTFFEEGELVGVGQPVVALLSPEHVYIVFFLPLNDLNKVKLRQKIRFNCAGCAPDNQATISYISPEAEYLPPLVYSRENADKLVFKLHAEIQNALQFKPGQPVSVTLDE